MGKGTWEAAAKTDELVFRAMRKTMAERVGFLSIGFGKSV
jgi:hypothetical protein